MSLGPRAAESEKDNMQEYAVVCFYFFKHMFIYNNPYKISFSMLNVLKHL